MSVENTDLGTEQVVLKLQKRFIHSWINDDQTSKSKQKQRIQLLFLVWLTRFALAQLWQRRLIREPVHFFKERVILKYI